MNFSPYEDPPDVKRDPLASTGNGSGSADAKKPKVKRPWFPRDASSFQGLQTGGYQSGGSRTDPTTASQSQSSNSNSNSSSRPHQQQQYSSQPIFSIDDEPPSSTNGGHQPEFTESGFGSSSGYSGGVAGSGGNGRGEGHGGVRERSVNAWETRFGFRVDVLAGAAYLGGPVTALALILIETTNDYVRFHAHQSALLTTPLLVFWLLMKLLGFWQWLRRIFLLLSLSLTLYTSYRAFRDPTSSDTASSLPTAALHAPGGHIPRFYLPVVGDMAERWVEG